MTTRIRLANILADQIDGVDELTLPGTTISELLHGLTGQYPQLHSFVWAGDGLVNPMVVVFLNNENIRGLQGLETPVPEGSEVTVISAIEGGAG